MSPRSRIAPWALVLAGLTLACTSGDGSNGASTPTEGTEGAVAPAAAAESKSVLEEVEVPSPEEAYEEAVETITEENADEVLEALEQEIESDS